MGRHTHILPRALIPGASTISISRRCLGAAILGFLLLAPSLARAGEFTAFPEPLPIKPFTLTERSGKTISLADLRGKVWVAHFFYPTCQGPCTKTLPLMRRLNTWFAGKSDIVLVSIALTGDEPRLLQEFARDQEASDTQWLFLTGDSDAVLTTVEKCFFQTARRKEGPKPGDEIDHTTSLVVVDRDGLMRGYVDGADHNNILNLVDAIRATAAERYRQPAVNAVLNALCAVLLVVGWLAIKRRRETLHKACMLTALAVSVAFLASYLWFHFMVLDGQPTRFRGEGWVRIAYFAILLSHTVLAAVVAPLAIYVAYQGLRDRRPRHVRVARWTLPIWLYVSITGVVVYVMLYQVYPPY